MNHKKNGHYRETDKKIRDTALNIILQQKVPTVAEICRRCKINRTTFYLHYEDLISLLDKMQEDIFSEFNRTSEEIGTITLMSYESFRLFAEHVKKNKEFYKLYFSINKSFPLKDGFCILWDNVIIPYYHKHGITDENIMLLRFVCVQAGFTVTLGKWVEQDFIVSTEEIAKILSECIAL